MNKIFTFKILLLPLIGILSIINVNAQQFPYISGPGIDIGTYAKIDTEQTYQIKYSIGSSTTAQNQMVRWTVNQNDCEIVKQNGNTPSITLKWKNAGKQCRIEAYNVQTANGVETVASTVEVQSTSIGNIIITAPEKVKLNQNLNISVEVRNTVGAIDMDISGNNFVKLSTSFPSQNIGNFTGYFTSTGIKTLTANVSSTGIPNRKETKTITVYPNTISGIDAIALGGGQAIYQLINAPNDNYIWTVSNNVQIISGQGSSRITVKENGKYPGNGFIQVVASGITWRKDIAVGVPQFERINVTFGSNNTLYANFPSRNESRATYSGSGTVLEYQWESTGWEAFNPLKPDKSVVFLKPTYTPSSQMANIKVRARNNVGWSDWMLFGARIDYSRSYNVNYSNSGIITISQEKEETTDLYKNNSSYVIYELYNFSTGGILKKGVIDKSGGIIDINNLPKGIYIVTLIIDSSYRETTKIIK